MEELAAARRDCNQLMRYEMHQLRLKIQEMRYCKVDTNIVTNIPCMFHSFPAVLPTFSCLLTV